VWEKDSRFPRASPGEDRPLRIANLEDHFTLHEFWFEEEMPAAGRDRLGEADIDQAKHRPQSEFAL
jgi:hypothetical protein